MRYALSFSAQFAHGFSFRIESDKADGGMLACVFAPSGQYLSPTTFGTLEPGEDDKRVLPPEEVAGFIFRLAALNFTQLERRIAPFSNCEVQAEIHLLQSWHAVRIGLFEGELLVKVTGSERTRISFAQLPGYLFEAEKRIHPR